MKPFLIAAAAFVALAACETPQLVDYRPVVDSSRVDAARFESDLAACRNVGLQAEAEYRERQNQQAGANILTGLLVGAVAGAVIGDSSSWAMSGAVSGAAAGAASTDTELAQGGPRRIIDRCMADRGYTILNDIGRG